MTLCYTIGLILTQACADFFAEDVDRSYMDDYAELQSHFGSLDSSMLSLFEAVSSGTDWGDYVTFLNPLPWIYTFVFLTFIFVGIFAILNVVTGVFVQGALDNAQSDRAACARKTRKLRDTYLLEMRQFFQDLDADGSGYITQDEFHDALCDGSTRDFFDAYGFEFQDMDLLFALLDREANGRVSCEDFLKGCMKLRGGARSLEMTVVLFQNKWLMHSVGRLAQCISKCHALADGFSDWAGCFSEPVGKVPTDKFVSGTHHCDAS